jgi:hypothetical protein
METALDATKNPASQTAPNQSMTGAWVLLGTIAATGALGLTSVIAFAPEPDTFLLLGALALPWLSVAVLASLPILIPAATTSQISAASASGARTLPATNRVIAVRHRHLQLGTRRFAGGRIQRPGRTFAAKSPRPGTLGGLERVS